MNIRTAILKAADSIEQNPKMFDYDSVDIPDCGSPACALGWIGFHLGMSCKKHGLGRDVCRALGIKRQASFPELTLFCGSHKWKDSAPECAKALRLYADKYHPADRFNQALISSQWSDCEFNPMVEIER